MDLLGSILNSMQKPPTATEAQKNLMRKQKEAIEKRQNQEKQLLNSFRRKTEEKIRKFVKDGLESFLQFEPMDHVYRSILREVAETAGLQVYSFGQEGVDRYPVIYSKEKGPSEDELTVRRNGGQWNEEKAAEMQQQRFETEKQEALDLIEERNRRKKRGKEELSGTFYKEKYAHLIGNEAALDAAQKTNMNKSYGEVPSENKKDLRSIEQTMADIKAKKLRRCETYTNQINPNNEDT